MQATARSIEAPRIRVRPSTTPTQSRRTDRAASGQLRAAASQIGSWLFWIVVSGTLYFGWSIRDEGYLTAESGIGYALGIIGGSLMLLLLLYPVRKRLRSMRRWLHIRHWFRIHMLFGILGPVLIVLHSGFRLGSTNGSVAFISMLIVAISGLAGRYFYTKIHHGLYGSRATFEDLKLSSEAGMRRVGFIVDFSPALSRRVQSFHAAAMSPSANFFHSMLRILLMGIWTRLVYLRISSRLDRAMQRESQRRGWSKKIRNEKGRIARRHLADYLATARKVVELNFYERLFSLWHVLHIPLFAMLVITGIGHVVAVHMY